MELASKDKDCINLFISMALIFILGEIQHLHYILAMRFIWHAWDTICSIHKSPWMLWSTQKAQEQADVPPLSASAFENWTVS